MAKKKQRPKGPAKRNKKQSAGTRCTSARGTDVNLSLDDLAELRQARALWAKDRIPHALRLFDRAARRNPNHVLALIDASRAFGSVYQYDRAESLLRRLLKLGGNRPEILYLIAQTYRLMRRPEPAIVYFQRALDAGSSNPDARLELALLHERANELTLAWEQVSARLRQKPDDDEGMMVKGRLLHRMGDFDKAEIILRDLAARRRAHWLTRMRAYSELAALYETQSAYDDAWQAMLDAKLLGAAHAAGARQHRDRSVGPLSALANDLSRDRIARWQATSIEPKSQRVALLTGMPRSGTTLLQQILDAHPDIVTGDEWDAFPRLVLPLMLGLRPLQNLDIAQLDQLSERHLARKRNMYFKFLSAALDEPLSGRLLIDKNPSLMPVLPAYQRLLPDSNLIIALRDPCDVLVSCLMTYFPLNDFSVDFLSLETAVTRLADDLNVWLTLREQIRDRWVEVKYEQLVDDFSGTLRQVLKALGLEWDDGLLEYRHRIKQIKVRSPSYSQVQLRIYRESQGRWRHYARYLEPVMPELTRLRELLGYPASGPSVSET